MDITAIAAATIAILSPYLAKAGEQVAEKAGVAIWEKATEILQAVKKRFGKEKDDFPTRTLEDFQRNPEKRQGAMKDALTEILEKDSEFSELLVDLLQDIDRAGKDAGVSINVFGGEVGEIFNIREVKGGVNIDKRSGK